MVSKEKYKILYEYSKPVIWNVTGFGNNEQLSILHRIIELLTLYDIDIPIKVLHGSYSCKYNGGRDCLYVMERNGIESIVKNINNKNIGIKLTFSNSNNHKDTFEEEELRWYLDLLNETKNIGNGVICINDDFAELVKKYYPSLEVVASHVKMEAETVLGETDTVDYYNSKFDLYDLVVFNTYRAFDDNFLSKIKHPEKVEFIVNHSCMTNCKLSKIHHKLTDEGQLIRDKYNHNFNDVVNSEDYKQYRKKLDDLMMKCKMISTKQSLENTVKQQINREEINHLIDNFNITHFKIEGRDAFLQTFITAINKYLINTESLFLF